MKDAKVPEKSIFPAEIQESGVRNCGARAGLGADENAAIDAGIAVCCLCIADVSGV